MAGCVMSTAFGETDRATARVLAANGCRVVAPAGQGCCGALHAHRGDRAGAQALARRNVDAFDPAESDAVIVNAAGCGATMKHYGDLLADDPAYARRGKALAAKVKDFTEFLAGLGPVPPVRKLERTVTYQEPCHLANAQRVREAPRLLLRAVPGLQIREMAESAMCCGSGALYNVTQEESSAALRARKVRNALATQAEVLVTANPGCFIQLTQGIRQAGAPLQIVHIADLLDEAYRE
jgi:glycolate oxidase iron-sulfur subunit